MADARITISRCGDYVVTVDAELEPMLRRYKWSKHYARGTKYYARAQRCPDTREPIRTYMHRLIASYVLGPPPGEGYVVDHINGDSLDNRACNLRWEQAHVNRWRWRSEAYQSAELRS